MQVYPEAGGLWAASLGLKDRPPGGLGMTLTGTLRITWALSVCLLFLFHSCSCYSSCLLFHSIL